MKRSCAYWVTVVMALVLLLAPATSIADTPQAAPLVEQTGSVDGMIRVRLSSFRSDTYNLTISGAYTMGGTSLANGSKVKVEFSGGSIYVTANGSRSNMGSSVTLSRQSGGVKIAESLAPANLYPGDMRFFYSSGTAYVVCYLYIEEYVYGVLPYEMDNSFPLEALKAQAVTARTYAIRAKTTSGSYDVTDTTTHQVFRGVNYSKTRCIQAVDETWGVVIKYGGSYAGAYYGASNGGQTEASNHVWGGTPIGYLQINDDPYDLENPNSVKKSYLIYFTPSQGSSVSAYSMIRNALANKLGGSANGYAIAEVVDIQLHTPLYAAPSKLYSRMRVTVRLATGNTEEVDIPIFPTVESTLGLGINSGNNELYTVEREAKGFRISARRYGHGVGMSQRGAEQMGELGFSYAQILGFYYTGIERVRMNFTTNWPGSVDVPKAVEDPAGITQETPATVSLTSAGDKLNLRKEAKADSEVLGQIANGASVTVLGETGEWCKVRYGSLTGYVSKAYLVYQAAPTPTPTPSVADGDMAMVRLASGSLNMRNEGRATATVIGSIPNGATVTIIKQGDSWSQVRYNNQTGYVVTQYLTFTQNAVPTPTPTPATQAGTAVVSLANQSETLNLRMYASLSAPVTSLLRNGTVLTVEERGDEWSKVSVMGMSGYVMNAFIAFGGDTAPVPTPTPTAPVQQTGLATVTLQSGTLNLRSQPNVGATVLGRVPNYARVEVLDASGTWSQIRYQGMTGYVSTGYLKIDAATGTPTQAQPTAAPTVGPTSTSAWVFTQDGDRVNLRRTASSSGIVLDRVPSGTEVTVYEKGDKWTLIGYNGYKGYVATQYLVAEKPATPGQTVAPQSGSSAWVSTQDNSSVYLRRQADAGADKLTSVPTGTEMTLLEAGAYWCKVIYKGQTGYMASQYVSFTPPAYGQATAQTVTAAPPAAQTQPPTATDVVFGNKTVVLTTGRTKLNSPTATLHLRESPSDLAAMTAALKQNETVEVLQFTGANASWVYVQSGSAKGYALREHFVLDGKLAAVSLKDTSTMLSLRSKANTTADVTATLPHGTLLIVVGTESGWARVRLGDGTIGYVSSEYLSDR